MSVFAPTLAVAMFIGCTGNTETTPDAEAAPTPEATANTATSESQKDKDENETTNALIPEGFPNDIYAADGSKGTEFREIGGKKNLVLDYPASESDEFVGKYQKGMSEQAGQW